MRVVTRLSDYASGEVLVETEPRELVSQADWEAEWGWIGQWRWGMQQRGRKLKVEHLEQP